MGPTEKRYYTIGEVAKLFGVAPSLIRYWEKRFTHLRPQTSKQGARKYTTSDVEKFKIVFQLIKEEGYTIQGAQEVLKNRTKRSSSLYGAIQNLKEIRSFLQDLQQAL